MQPIRAASRAERPRIEGFQKEVKYVSGSAGPAELPEFFCGPALAAGRCNDCAYSQAGCSKKILVRLSRTAPYERTARSPERRKLRGAFRGR